MKKLLGAALLSACFAVVGCDADVTPSPEGGAAPDATMPGDTMPGDAMPGDTDADPGYGTTPAPESDPLE